MANEHQMDPPTFSTTLQVEGMTFTAESGWCNTCRSVHSVFKREGTLLPYDLLAPVELQHQAERDRELARRALHVERQDLPSLNEIVRRCSRHSGFKLEWHLKESAGHVVLEIAEPHKDRSRLVLMLDESGTLHEAYGRMRHWAITGEEIEVLENVLKAASR